MGAGVPHAHLAELAYGLFFDGFGPLLYRVEILPPQCAQGGHLQRCVGWSGAPVASFGKLNEGGFGFRQFAGYLEAFRLTEIGGEVPGG